MEVGWGKLATAEIWSGSGVTPPAVTLRPRKSTSEQKN